MCETNPLYGIIQHSFQEDIYSHVGKYIRKLQKKLGVEPSHISDEFTRDEEEEEEEEEEGESSDEESEYESGEESGDNSESPEDDEE